MRKLALPLIACATFGLAAAPSMAVSTNVKQNKKIAKINGAVKGVQKAIKLLEDADKTQDAGAAGLKATVDNIVAVAGTALPALQDGLLKLKAGLETAGAALTKLGGVVDSSIAVRQTIVSAQVFSGGVAASNAIRGCFVSTPPLPYNGNMSTVTVNCPVVQIQTDPGAGENAPAAGGPLVVLASCRTAKTNTDLAGGKPCALAGIANLTINSLGSAPTTFLTSKPNASFGGAPAWPLDANKLYSTDADSRAFPFSFVTSGDDPVDDAAKLVNLTDASVASFPAGAPTLGTCASGMTPCLSTVTLTLRAADANSQVPS
jgi:hypothetical protein